MRHLIIIVLTPLLLATAPARAQSTADLIQQLILDAEKLASMKAILQDMYKGYEILNQGYTEIKNIAAGNFNLHRLFLDGLLAVSPAVRNDPRIMDIFSNESQLVSDYKNALKMLHSSPRFSVQELDYFGDTYTSVFRRSLQSIDELTMILTAGELRMSDAQRLRSIDRVHTEIRDQLQFLRNLHNNISLQALQREKESQDINTLKLLYGNPY